jgi:peptide methionine sulfoxide reductase MsrB
MARKTRKATMQDRRAAVAGEMFVYNGKDFTVTPRPGIASSEDPGFWFCITCGISLRSNLEKDAHCGEPAARKPSAKLVKVLGAPARHVLCWVDWTTGENQEP